MPFLRRFYHIRLCRGENDHATSTQAPVRKSDLYPDGQHIREVGLKKSQDVDIWEYANATGFVIVSKDTDFQQRLLYEHPPKVVWLRVGNCTVQTIEDLLRDIR